MNVLTHTHKEKKTINNELNVSFNVCLYVCWCVKDEYFVAICALLQFLDTLTGRNGAIKRVNLVNCNPRS